MQVIMGIAPARDSKHFDGKADAFCDSTGSGKKVRCLAGETNYHFANATDVFPGDRPGGRGNYTPTRTEGYKRLLSIIEVQFQSNPVDVLLLGTTYWKRVLSTEDVRSHLIDDIGPIPVAVSIPFYIDGTCSALLHLFPHPRNWPHPNGRTGPCYKKFLAKKLASQPNKCFSGSSNHLGQNDYAEVLSKFNLGAGEQAPGRCKLRSCFRRQGDHPSFCLERC